MTTQTLHFETPDQGQETARADLYGLLATLFYAPPAESLLAAIRGVMTQQAEDDSHMGLAWRSLAATALPLTQIQVADEYTLLFQGVGKPEIFLYGSFYLSGFLMEKPLVALREDLKILGLEKPENVNESEDHIASVCEVMRYLIASDDVEKATLHNQQQFFRAHLAPWFNALCDAVEAHPKAHFYAHVAKLSRAFFEVESQAFDLLN